MTQESVDALLDILDLEQLEVNLFRGESPDENRQRVFGGQVAGQALIAASRTVGEGDVHSLHSYFLRPGDPSVPIVYQTERVRDGRSFTTRRVIAVQHGQPIFHLSASFHRAEDGVEHQFPMPEGLPEPLSLPDFAERMAPMKAQLGESYDRPRPIDTRPIPRDQVPDANVGGLAPQYVWMRADGSLPADPVIHQCVLTYASDMTLLDTVVVPHDLSWLDGNVMMASLDHAMWFHHPFQADRWFLYVQDSPAAAGARGLARGLIFQDGKLVVSVVQEGLVRSLRAD